MVGQRNTVMLNYAPIRLLVLLIPLVLLVVSMGLAGQTIAGATAEIKTLDRDLEPVIIKGAGVGLLRGTPVEHLFVYTYTGTDWGGQIPSQVDKITASGGYTSTGGNLNNNDEIVFMAKDLGDRAPDTEPLTATLPISNAWYEIEVSDPLSPTKKGWAYLVRSNELSSTFSGDYVDYIASTQHITANQYELGFPTTYEGMEYLAINGSGVDILDRTKLRVVLDLGTLGVTTMTEQNLINPQIAFVKDGPVRVILQQAVQRTVVPGSVEANLSNTYLAYDSLFQTTSETDFDLGGLATLSRVRTSVDLHSVVSGAATFYNANTPLGVPINGSPDAVAETPFSNWTQVSHPSGRLIQVTDPTSAGGTPQNFYRDNSNPESHDDTGDNPGSYGDSGILIEGGVNQIFSTRNSFFILPPPDGGPDNVGDTYEEYFFDPLTTSLDFPPVFLPIILKG